MMPHSATSAYSNGQTIKVRKPTDRADTKAGTDIASRYYHEFFAEPFSDGTITRIVDPGQKGREILQPAEEALPLLMAARSKALRKPEGVEVLLFAAKNYQVMGKKLIMREHYLDPKTPRSQVVAELSDLVGAYESLREEFKRLWLADCKDAGSFPAYLKRYDDLIAACNKKIAELRGP
jgi:hypothetical protein